MRTNHGPAFLKAIREGKNAYTPFICSVQCAARAVVASRASLAARGHPAECECSAPPPSAPSPPAAGSLGLGHRCVLRAHRSAELVLAPVWCSVRPL